MLWNETINQQPYHTRLTCYPVTLKIHLSESEWLPCCCTWMCTLHTYTCTISSEYTLYTYIQSVGTSWNSDSPQLFQVLLWVSNHKFYTWLLQIHPPSLWHTTTKITTEDKHATIYQQRLSCGKCPKNVQTRRINFSFHRQTMTMFHGPICDAAAHPATQQFFGGGCAGNEGHNPPHQSNPWSSIRAWTLLPPNPHTEPARLTKPSGHFWQKSLGLRRIHSKLMVRHESTVIVLLAGVCLSFSSLYHRVWSLCFVANGNYWNKLLVRFIK